MHARALSALLFLLLPAPAGCFNITDELVINADGSGSVRLETRWLVDPESLSSPRPGAGMNIWNGISLVYPPTNESDAKRFFPAQQFVVTTKTETAADGSSPLIVTAAFKGIEALLASPYAKIHALTLQIQDGTLKLQAVNGIEAAVRLAEANPESDPNRNKTAGSELKKKKNEMRAEFRVRLPGTITSAGSGGVRDDRSVTWILERAKLTNAAAFAAQAGAVLQASCSAEGVGFKPSVAPPRLSIMDFKETPSGAWGAAAPAVDAKKVRASAKFVPYALHVSRTLDLSGDGGVGQSRAQLVGAVVLPKDMLPEKWGEVEVEEILDARGVNLKLAHDPNNARRFYATPTGAEADPGDNKEGGDQQDHRHPFNIVFQAPEWSTKEMPRIKGRIGLQDFGGSLTVKLEKAIPADWIRETKNGDEFDFDLEEGRNINDPQLPGLGLSLNLTMGASQGPVTSLTFQVESPNLTLIDGQVYDVEGRPWPTFFQLEDSGGENSMTLVVAGNPKAPLSLALLARLVGENVEIPFELEKLPIGAK